MCALDMGILNGGGVGGGGGVGIGILIRSCFVCM